MSQKSLYKKTIGPGWDHPEGVQRPRENRFFESAQSEKVGSKSKSKTRNTPRSNHKHIYKPALVWRKSWFSYLEDAVISSVVMRCDVCGKIEERISSFFQNKEEKYYGELLHYWSDEQDNAIQIDSTKYKKKIFLGGSKIVNELGDKIKSDLFSFMNCGHDILIGDCMGADFQMQKLLAENGYQNVTVYYSGDRPRTNLGGWKAKHISSNKFMSDYERQKLKDDEMARECNIGYMVLRGMTKGTMANIVALVNLNKKCDVALINEARICPITFSIKDMKGIEKINWYYEH